MGADFVVSTAFKSRDQMSSTFRKMGMSADKFTNKTVRGFKRIERQGLSLRKIMGGILGAAAVQRGLGLMRQGVSGVIDEFLDFEDSITAASAKFGIFDRASQPFKELGKTAREVGASTEFTAAQAAGGLRFLAKAGWDANSAMRVLPGLVDLATASEMDFARATDIATDVMGAFGLKSDDAAQNMLELTRVSDVLSKAVNMSNVDMEDLFETIKFAGPIAKTAGVELESFAAMAAFVGGAGIKGSLGGTALRTMFLTLAAPTDKIKGKIAEFNTEIKNVGQIKKNRKALEKLLKVQLEVGGKLKSPVEIMKMFNEGMAKLSDTQKAATLNMIFGKRAVTAAAVSMEGATGELQKFEEALKDSKGNASKLATFMRGSLSKRLDELKSATIEIGFKFIDEFEKDIPGGLTALTESVRNFDVKGTIDSISKLTANAKELFRVLNDFKGVIIGIGAGIAAAKIIPFAIGVGQAVAEVGGLIVGLKGVAAAGGLGGVAAKLGGLAGLAAPVFAAAAAIGGVTAAIYTVWQNWDDLKLTVGWLIDDITGWWSKKAGHLKSIGKGIWNISDVLSHPVPPGGIPSKAPVEKPAEKPATMNTNALGWPVLGRSRPEVPTPGTTKIPATGIPTPKVPEPTVQPRQEARSRARDEWEQRQQSVQFEGQLDITGAPAGSKFESKTRGGSRPVRVEMLGSN